MKEIISIAPGRTCLFGDHQDYLGLPIIACAIDKHITIKAVKNNKENFVIDLPDINQKRTISIYQQQDELEQGDFLQSSLQVLKRYNCTPSCGYDVLITGTIPINSGTSSSSALTVAWIQFLLKAFGPEELLSPEKLSQLAYEAEVLELNAPGGKMDQYSIGLGNIIYLETGEDFSYQVLKNPIPGLIMADSGVPKETTALLHRLKTNSWKAIKEVQKHIPHFTIETANLAHLDEYLNYLSDDLKPYLEAALGNYTVTKTALLEFKKERLNLNSIGQLMNKHHYYLKELLKITVPKIDKMIDAALSAGALGAKIVGSGGGGSIAVISDETNKNKIIAALNNAGAKSVYFANVDPGARLIK
ncbi:mevalonate kinase family protein [Polaribacter sp. P097]|uniref:mevalonate kinase family protein n=1 Tax=Polaribacter sp. P097 TaxID=3117398 RepID=UPI002FE35D16